MAGLCVALRTALGAPPPTADTHNPAAFRPQHLSGLYRTRSIISSTNTGRDSEIVAHVKIREARDGTLDPAMRAAHNERLLESTRNLLTALRADEAEESSGSEHSFSPYVSESRGDLIKELEEERDQLLKEMNPVPAPAPPNSRPEMDTQSSIQTILEENRKLQDQLDEHKKETEELQQYRLFAQQRMTELELLARDPTDEMTSLRRRAHGDEERIKELTSELELANANVKDGQGERKTLRERNEVLEQHLLTARTEIDRLRRRRWFG